MGAALSRSHRGQAVSLLVVLAAAGCAPTHSAHEPGPSAENAIGRSADPGVSSSSPADADRAASTGTPGPEASRADASDEVPHREPAGLRIPAIDLDENLIDLGLTPDGSLEVPGNGADVGWFSGGGHPGGPGPTVIAGHVDSRTGPAVFYRLTELRTGDVITVVDDRGESFDYVVDQVAQHPKDEFPTVEVFGATPDDQLRLITCTGPWDETVESYEDNHIVYASPVE